jgi:drug/metabolite transporter (DMT)-like permease
MPGWFVWSGIAVLCWGLWAVAGRLLGDALSAAQSQAFSTLGILPILAALRLSGRAVITGNPRRGRWIAFGSGLAVCAGNVAYYQALNAGAKASTVVPLTALYPMVTVVLAAILLRESLTGVQWTGIGLSLAAIWMFNGGTLSGAPPRWIGLALAPILLWGIGGLLQKMATSDLSAELSTVWFLWAFLPFAAGILCWDVPSHVPPGRVWIVAGGLGLLFGLGNFALLRAFAAGGKASVVAPMAGLYPVVSIPAAILVFHERVEWREWVGILVALLGVAALSLESPADPGPAIPGSQPEPKMARSRSRTPDT